VRGRPCGDEQLWLAPDVAALIRVTLATTAHFQLKFKPAFLGSLTRIKGGSAN